MHSLDRDDENKIYGDDDGDDEISGRGQNDSGDFFDFHDSGYKESSLSRDQAQHKDKHTGEDRHGGQKKKQNHSRTANPGSGAGLLLSLVVTAFVLGVVSIVFLRR